MSQSSLSTSFEEREDSSATPTASDENLARQKKESISELEEPAEELGAGLGARASDVGEPTRTDVEMNTNITRASEQCTCQVATQTRTNITPVGGGGGEVVNKSRAVTPGSEGQGLCVEAGAQRRGSVCEQPQQPPTISVCFANSEAEEEDRRRRRSLGNAADRSLDEDHGEAEEVRGELEDAPEPELVFLSQQVYFTSEEADDDAGSMGYTRLPDPPAPQDMSPLAEDDNFSESFSQPNQSSLEQVEYDIMMDGDNLAPGCVAPAPTPAPSIAPLAEVEMDPGDDEQETTASDHTETAVTVHVTTRERQEQEPEASAGATVVIIEDQVKRRKRKERKERGEKEQVQQQRSEEENSEKKGNAVCPWDDE